MYLHGIAKHKQLWLRSSSEAEQMEVSESCEEAYLHEVKNTLRLFTDNQSAQTIFTYQAYQQKQNVIWKIVLLFPLSAHHNAYPNMTNKNSVVMKTLVWSKIDTNSLLE